VPNETRKVHHYLQRAYLARFAGHDGLVWQHNLETFESKRVHPNVAASEKYLYAPLVPTPRTGMKVVVLESTAEDWLERLDRGSPGPLLPGVLICAF
jgi:hypothetical protein